MATRWVTDNAPGHSQRYIERFRQLAAEGKDLTGEARLLDAMLSRGSRLLDAGCGPGRVGAELAARGHTVVGVDADAELIAAAKVDHPGSRWLVADLSELDLAAEGETEPFDAATVALAHAVAAATSAGHLRSVAGGGDTVAALKHAGVLDKMSYVSTAGGAFLEWLEGKMLPGILALQALDGVAIPA